MPDRNSDLITQLRELRRFLLDHEPLVKDAMKSMNCIETAFRSLGFSGNAESIGEVMAFAKRILERMSPTRH